MIILLRCLFIGILLSMLCVTSWASTEVALWNTPRAVATHPWFIATLFDTYFAFLAFWLWVAWRAASWPRAVAWLIAICLLGNIAMAVYMLIILFRLPRTATMQDVICPRQL
jgi:Protein of unknown function (DUF1475)